MNENKSINKTDITDRMEISDLLSRYFRAVDDKCLDNKIVEVTFTMDARIVRPNGVAITGWEDILKAQTKSFARFRATHHVTTDHIIDIDGDKANLRANLTAMHLWAFDESDPNTLETHFLAGGVFLVSAIRTEAGWRISELSNRNTWRSGNGTRLITGQ